LLSSIIETGMLLFHLLRIFLRGRPVADRI
jgi:hypothetical protein